MIDKILSMSIKNKIDEDAITELTEHLNEYKDYYRMYIRILAVKMVKSGETKTKVAEYVHVDRRTVGLWVKAYDNGGINGLMPKYANCGLKCRLTDEQLLELKEIVTDPHSNYTIKETQKLIEDKYGIKYSYKQVWVITRQKLGLNYRKPFIKYAEAPKNPDNILKKN